MNAKYWWVVGIFNTIVSVAYGLGLIDGFVFISSVCIIGFGVLADHMTRLAERAASGPDATRATESRLAPCAPAAFEPDDASDQPRVAAATLRRKTSLAIALADAVPAAGPAGELLPQAVLRAAACETLGDMLERQAHAGDDATSASLTALDFEQLRELAGRLTKQRAGGRHGDAVSRAAAVLEAQTALGREAGKQLAEALAGSTRAETAFRAVVRDAAGQLRHEIALCDRRATRSGDRPPLAPLIDAYSREEEAALADVDGPDAPTASSQIGGAGPAVIDTEGGRIKHCLERVASALATFEREAEAAAPACVRAAETAISGLGAAGLVRRRTEIERSPTVAPPPPDMPTAVLLEYGRQPQLESLACSADLAVLLNVVKDAAQAATGRAEATTITAVAERVLAALRHADAAITRAISMPTHAARRLAAARGILQALESGIDLRLVKEAATALETDLERAHAEMKAAEQMARLGEFDLAERMAARARERSLGAVDRQAVDETVAAGRSWLKVAEDLFDRVRNEAARLTMWRQGFAIEGAGPPSADTLRTGLADFFRHRSTMRLGPDSVPSRMFDDWGREREVWCRLVDVEAPPCDWAVMTTALRHARPAAVDPAHGFVDALCAMSSAHKGIGGREAATIRDAVTRCRLPLDPAAVTAILAGWQKTAAGKGHSAAIAQAIVNVDAIGERRLLESLHRGLRAVARADGTLDEAEICVYHAFLIRIVPRLHGGGD